MRAPSRSRVGRRALPRGFSLIEVMIVIAIIGILASVAMPISAYFLYRAKQAERSTMMRRMEYALKDAYPSFEKLGEGTYAIEPNPAAPSTAGRALFNPNLGNWRHVTVPVDGLMYYRYEAEVIVSADPQIILTVEGDVDADGVPDSVSVTLSVVNGGWERTDEDDWGDDF